MKMYIYVCSDCGHEWHSLSDEDCTCPRCFSENIDFLDGTDNNLDNKSFYYECFNCERGWYSDKNLTKCPYCGSNTIKRNGELAEHQQDNDKIGCTIDILNDKHMKCMEANLSNPLYNKIIKLQEESGEVASEFLKMINAQNASKSANGSVESLFEEVVDVIIVAKDILYNLNKMNPDKLNYKQVLSKKIDKWYSKLKDKHLIKEI
jgi:DNA-directed RNA polymerase subunit RPC12/RpoP/NTP pyrophosphatase (non-canonical NTP hydrolase)